MNATTLKCSPICKTSSTISVLLLLALALPVMLFPAQSGAQLNSIYKWTANHFGVFYLLLGLACALFLVWLGSSRYGKIKLGNPTETIEFRELPWAGMLFCAGIGAGLLRWASVEWGYIYLSLAHGVQAQ